MAKTTTMDLVAKLEKEFPHLTAKNIPNSWHVDFLEGKKHLIGVKYDKKADSWTMYLPNRMMAAITANLTDEVRASFTYHEKWGMPWELKGTASEIAKTIPAMRKAFKKATAE